MAGLMLILRKSYCCNTVGAKLALKSIRGSSSYVIGCNSDSIHSHSKSCSKMHLNNLINITTNVTAM